MEAPRGGTTDEVEDDLLAEQLLDLGSRPHPDLLDHRPASADEDLLTALDVPRAAVLAEHEVALAVRDVVTLNRRERPRTEAIALGVLRAEPDYRRSRPIDH